MSRSWRGPRDTVRDTVRDTGAATRGEPDVAHEVAAELTELADTLAGLPDEAWDAPSLCEGWRVREVVSHVTLPMHASTAAVAWGFVRSGFRWDRLADRRARLDGRRTPDELVAALRAPRMQAWTPPGGGATGALVHAVVHGLDITRALGLERRPPPDRLRLVLDGLTSPRSLAVLGADVTGVQLHATDLDWRHGEGRVVRAPAVDLALILAGRRPLPRLSNQTSNQASDQASDRS
ncbi:MAG: hypothetical protein JWP82_943 [Humibacillus sp.]|nr:hypothetical protein [Humibacillus sp.]